MTDALGRETRLTIEIDGEEIDLVALRATEALSQPFYIEIDVLSQLGELDIARNLGKQAVVESLRDGEHLRYFHGILTDGQMIGEANSGTIKSGDQPFLYRLVLQPREYFFSFGRDYRIYQDKSPVDIIKEVFQRCGIPIEDKLQSLQLITRKLPYCVQFGESDMAFVHRLMEEHGIYYFYRHEQKKHVLVLCNDPNSHTALDDPKFIYHPLAGSISQSSSSARGAAGQTVTRWQEFHSSGGEYKASLRDYDFTKTDLQVLGESTGAKTHDGQDIEVYDWPGRFYAVSEGQGLAAVALEARAAQRVRHQGDSECTSLQTGYKFSLEKHPVGRLDAEYLIIATQTTLANEAYRSGGGGGETEVHFTAIPADLPYRAPLVTPRPAARGPETAVVVGPSGEEIYVDKYGRIKVQFHWDRIGKKDEHSSCWIRVSQTGGLGNIILPRIGHEVLVDFINGDPDRPIVVGRVFNASFMPQYPLPDHKTRTVWRSKTYKRTTSSTPGDGKDVDGGDKPAANEIRMEDKTDNEEFYIHAEKDLLTVVRYDENHKVGHNQTILVRNDRTETVEGKETITIQKDRTETVKANETVTVEGNRDVEIKGNDTLKVNGDLKIDVVGAIDISANTRIILKIGSTKVEIMPTAVNISTVQIDASANATAKFAGSGMVSVESSGLTKVQGSLVKIN